MMTMMIMMMMMMMMLIGIIRARDRDDVMSTYRSKAKESIVIKLKQQVAEGALIGYQQERGQEKTCRFAQVAHEAIMMMVIMMITIKIR